MTAILEWEDEKKAREWFQSPVLKQAQQKAGVTSLLEMHVLGHARKLRCCQLLWLGRQPRFSVGGLDWFQVCADRTNLALAQFLPLPSIKQSRPPHPVSPIANRQSRIINLRLLRRTPLDSYGILFTYGVW